MNLIFMTAEIYLSFTDGWFRKWLLPFRLCVGLEFKTRLPGGNAILKCDCKINENVSEKEVE